MRMKVFILVSVLLLLMNLSVFAENIPYDFEQAIDYIDSDGTYGPFDYHIIFDDPNDDWCDLFASQSPFTMTDTAGTDYLYSDSPVFGVSYHKPTGTYGAYWSTAGSDWDGNPYDDRSSNYKFEYLADSDHDIKSYADPETVLLSATYSPLVYYQSDSNAFNLKAEDLVQNYGYRVYKVEHVVNGFLKADTKIAVPENYDSVLSLYSVSGSFIEVAHTGESEIFYYDTPDMRDDQYGSMDISADYGIYSFPDGDIPVLHSEEEITNLYKMFVVDSSSTMQLIDSQERDLGSSWNLIYNPSTYTGVERWGILVDLTDEELLTVQDFKDNVHIGNDVAWTYVSDTLSISDGRVQGIMWFDYTIWLNTQYDLDIKYRTLLYDSVTINSISTTGESTSSTDTTGIIVDDEFDLSDWILHPIETITSLFRNLASQVMNMIDAMIPTAIIAPEIKALIMLSACVSLLLVILGRK